jgi:hypothetical protein
MSKAANLRQELSQYLSSWLGCNQIEAEAWALLRQRCAHLDRTRLTPVRKFVPFGGVRLRVDSVDTMLPIAVCSIPLVLVQEGEEG